MTRLTADQAARRAGVELDYFAHLVAEGLVPPDEHGRFTRGQARRAQFVQTLEQAGVALEGLARAVRSGEITLDFIERESYEAFAGMSEETFEQVSLRTGIPLELLVVMREAIGLEAPSPRDRLRDDEMRVVPFLETQIRLGFRSPAVERLLRVMGESLRRIAEQEADWWRTEVIEPALAAGLRGASLAEATSDLASSTDILTDARVSLLAMLDAWRAQNWTKNIIVGLESDLVRLGLYQRVNKPPAVCFFDISGYTRLTQERGDEAAAELARDLGRLVQRVSTSRRGKPIKWLGDGVMLYFGEPAKAVEAALEMVDGVARFGLPPAHVGIDAGPVLFQEGDYFGKTVNVASRIADYARPGEVLVSQAVVDASGDNLVFSQIGPVELKGVGSAIVLFAAHPH